MGVDYSASVGYGFEIPYDDIEPIAERLGFPESEWGFDYHEFGYWLVDGLDLICDLVGDFMNGEDLYLVVSATGAVKDMEMFGWHGSLSKFNYCPTTDDQMDQLEDLFVRLYQREPGPRDIGWYMATTVS